MPSKKPAELSSRRPLYDTKRHVRSHRNFPRRRILPRAALCRNNGTPIKITHGNHNRDFNDEEYAKSTELSKEVWKIKNRGFNPIIKWKIIKQLPAYNPENKICRLCLGEKIEILNRDPVNLLNKRSELISTCRHRNKYLIHQYDVT